MDRAALPRAAVAVRAEEGATAAAEGMTPVGPAPLIKEARTGFRERLASLSRGIEGIAAHQAVSEQSGKLGRLFDAQAGRGTVRAPAPAVEAEAAEPADPRWGERLWERLRDGADPALRHEGRQPIVSKIDAVASRLKSLLAEAALPSILGKIPSGDYKSANGFTVEIRAGLGDMVEIRADGVKDGRAQFASLYFNQATGKVTESPLKPGHKEFKLIASEQRDGVRYLTLRAGGRWEAVDKTIILGIDFADGRLVSMTATTKVAWGLPSGWHSGPFKTTLDDFITGRLDKVRLAPAKVEDSAQMVRTGAPRWGERLWELLRDNPDPSPLLGPIRDAIRNRPDDPQTGYALQFLYFFPLGQALPIWKENLDGPFRRQILMALKSYAVLETNPVQKGWANLHVYGKIQGRLPSDHALVDRRIEAAILEVLRGGTPDLQEGYFIGGGGYAMALMAAIPSRNFSQAAHQYIDEHWRDAASEFDGINAEQRGTPSIPFSWFRGMLDVAIAQADADDVAFLTALDMKLKGLAEEIWRAREARYESLAKAGRLYRGWHAPYDLQLKSLARVHVSVAEAIEAVRRRGQEAPSALPRLIDAGRAAGGGL